jgi:pseudaminic acid synthase
MKIGNREIGGNEPPYCIAEISGNHCGEIKNAIELIKQAKIAGADAVKTQCYEPDTLTLNIKKPDFIVQDGLWKGRTLWDLYSKACTPLCWHKELYHVAKEEGITIFSSVFDRSGVDLLESLGCPCFKVASFEISDLPLIEYAAATEKPLIISTGLATDQEIIDANEATGRTADGRAAFLHCTSDYPGTIETADLSRIGHIDWLLGFNNPVGISDHTTGTIVPIMATTLRAAIIEKHLKLPDIKSEDDSFSLNCWTFAAMAYSVKATHKALGKQEPNGSKQFRRSLYAVKPIKEGEKYTKENIRSIRPGYGLPPKMLPRLLGKKAKKAFRTGDALS